MRLNSTRMKQKFILFATLCTICLLSTSCDDGHIDDPVFDYCSDGYNVQITGTFKRLDTWTGNYSVVAAAFNDESEYSLIQKVLPSAATDSTTEVVSLSNVSAHAQTIEIAVVNTLRKRIATIYSYPIPNNQHPDDTIKINVGELNVGMFGAINHFIFQGTGTNCARCHSTADGAGHLDLTAENAYASLVNVAAYKDNTQTRVIPFDAANSFFYKVIKDGDESISYSHTGLLTEDKYAVFLDIIAAWINGGAKE